MAGSAIGSNKCTHFTLRTLDTELAKLEEQFGRKAASESSNPDYTSRTFAAEVKAWRDYKKAQCAFYGATEGGSDSWKNAFAGMCEVDETLKRIAYFKKELGTQR